MATIKPQVKTMLEKFGLNPREALWDCHGTWVLLHSACQAIAMRLNIKFDEPDISFLDLDKKQCVIKLRGYIACEDTGNCLGGQDRWDFGEAAPGNNKNSYPISMALKRAEDKIILHLAKLREHGVYSSEEADEFKDRPVNSDQKGFADRIKVLISEASNVDQVKQIVQGHKGDLNNLPVRERNGIKKLHDKKVAEFKGE